MESDSTPRPVLSAAGAAVVIEPPRTTHPAVLAPPAEPTEAEQLVEEAHGDGDIVTLLEETQRDLESANRTIDAMKADDQKAPGVESDSSSPTAAAGKFPPPKLASDRTLLRPS